MPLIRIDALLNRLPAPLHRGALRLAHALRRVWWRMASPQIQGSRVVALDAEGRVLLVRHAYGSPLWMPPGGGLSRGEDPVLAGVREFEEETGCALSGARLVAITNDRLHGARSRVSVLAGRTSGTPRPDQREIAEAAFFPLDALPEDLARGLAQALPRWASGGEQAADEPAA